MIQMTISFKIINDTIRSLMLPHFSGLRTELKPVWGFRTKNRFASQFPAVNFISANEENFFITPSCLLVTPLPAY
jgi:hypothetical protein